MDQEGTYLIADTVLCHSCDATPFHKQESPVYMEKALYMSSELRGFTDARAATT